MRRYYDIIVCITNKCPKCKERFISEGSDSIKIGDNVTCENCGNKFGVTNITNAEASSEPWDEHAKEKIMTVCPYCGEENWNLWSVEITKGKCIGCGKMLKEAKNEQKIPSQI